MKESLLLFLRDQWQNNRGRSAGFLLGGLFGIAVLVFGFWPTVFFLCCAVIGMYIGQWKERSGTWTDLRGNMMESVFVQRLFRRMR